MKIDHTENPLGIVKRYNIPYGDGLYLEARIHGITEEGHDEVNWFGVSIIYQKLGSEIGGNLNNYQKLKRGAPTLEEAERKLIKWCEEERFKISEIEGLVKVIQKN